jgi:rare lipoprotein A
LTLAVVLGLLCTLFPAKDERGSAPEQGVLETHGIIASYYGDAFHGRCMANGLMFDKNDMVAAHRTLPLGTPIRVHRGARSVVVIVMDRGPYIEGRHLDLSEGAARKLGMIHVGVSPVVMEVLDKPLRSVKYHQQNRRCLDTSSA